jgi:two-component sensor histidine kinase
LEETAKGEFSDSGELLRIKGLTRDISERKRAENHHRLLISELDHRVKNTLATVSAVAAQTLEASTSMQDFVAALDGRIRAIAFTHELLSGRQWKGLPLADLARCQLAPFAAQGNIEIKGPDVVLSPAAGQTLAMVLHELATNAAKHGALSNRGGRVALRWRSLKNGAAGRLAIEWRELDGPPIAPSNAVGYGTTVIRELVPFELGGKVDLTLAADGLRCRLEIPPQWISRSKKNLSPF